MKIHCQVCHVVNSLVSFTIDMSQVHLPVLLEELDTLFYQVTVPINAPTSCADPFVNQKRINLYNQKLIAFVVCPMLSAARGGVPIARPRLLNMSLDSLKSENPPTHFPLLLSLRTPPPPPIFLCGLRQPSVLSLYHP